MDPSIFPISWFNVVISACSSADDSGDENGERLRESLLVIRSRRRSRQPISLTPAVSAIALATAGPLIPDP